MSKTMALGLIKSRIPTSRALRSMAVEPKAKYLHCPHNFFKKQFSKTSFVHEYFGGAAQDIMQDAVLFQHRFNLNLADQNEQR
jgi:hypothetical protein